MKNKKHKSAQKMALKDMSDNSEKTTYLLNQKQILSICQTRTESLSINTVIY